MAKTCDFKTSEASTKAWMRKRNLLTKFLEIPESKLTHFRQQNSYWSKKAFQRHHQAGIKPGDMLFYEEPGAKKVMPNTEMFHRIDADKGNFYQENLKYVNDIKTTSNISTDVKAGVLELFESNPEIANSVYEALGFNQETNLQDTWINYVIKKDNISKEEVLQRLETYKPKMITVYRGEGSIVNLENSNIPDHIKKSKGRWFTKDKKVAQQYAEMQKGSLYALQIPETLFDNISKELNLQNTNGVEALLPQELVNEKVKLSTQITPQQKQQAQQRYSQYIDTIFPDSKVKDVVYHGSDKVLSNVRSLSKEERNFRDQFQIEDGIFFSKEREGSSYSANEYGDVITPAIVNVQNPELSTYYNTKLGKKLKNSDSLLGTQIGLKPEDTIEDSLKRFNESYETTDFNSWSNIVVVFKPEQVHILGSKQDVKGFKEFADSTSKQLSDKFVDDLYNLNLTPEVITYLYNENGSTSKLEDYAFILRDLVNNLKSQGFTNQQILEDIKCL